MVRQQLAILQNEFEKRQGMQHQPAPVTPVHVSKEKKQKNREETNIRRSK